MWFLILIQHKGRELIWNSTYATGQLHFNFLIEPSHMIDLLIWKSTTPSPGGHCHAYAYTSGRTVAVLSSIALVRNCLYWLTWSLSTHYDHSIQHFCWEASHPLTLPQM